MNKLILFFLLTPFFCFSETVKVEIPVNKDEALWECNAPSGNSYYVKLPKGKKYNLGEVCGFFIKQVQKDFSEILKPNNTLPLPPLPNLPLMPCEDVLEGMPCLKLP